MLWAIFHFLEPRKRKGAKERELLARLQNDIVNSTSNKTPGIHISKLIFLQSSVTEKLHSLRNETQLGN